MADSEFEVRLDRVARAAEAVRAIENVELQAEAFRYLLDSDANVSDAHDGATTHNDPSRQEPEHGASDARVDGDKNSNGRGDDGNTSRVTRKKSGAKKQTFTFDKDLDIYVTSGTTGEPFKSLVSKHFPTTQEHRVVVAVYWLKKELNTAAVKIDQVYTVFKTMGWLVPSDLANTIAKAGSRNFLDSKKRDDIGITTHGENLVEHQLKPEPQA